jgi:hypothetical protein
VLTNVLLDEVDLAVRVKISVDFEFSDFVTTTTLNLIVPNIHVVKDHFDFIAVLHVDTSPSLVGTSHLEGV